MQTHRKERRIHRPDKMFGKLYPYYTASSTYAVDFKELYSKGFRGLIFDIDNTLVGHNAPADERCIAFFKELHAAGFKTMLLSNNDEARVKPFAELNETDYIFLAHKPSVKGYIEAMERMGTDADTTLFVGDQIFTDIWGANKSGIRSLMVGKVAKYEEFQIVLKRILEKPILFCYKKSKNYRRIA